jgi:alginate O-acetyltransferase complex protein AlgI
MVFSSPVFLFAFLPLLLLIYHAAHPRLRNPLLLVFSLVFYAWWRVDFVLLLVASTLVDYVVGMGMYRSTRRSVRRGWLAVSLVFNLGLLGYFKYANFGIESFNQLLAAVGVGPVSWTQIVLPVGISFFTFQTMSYSIDVYRGHVEPERNPIRFGTYVSMFPQLVAGPIVRFGEIRGQLHERRFSLDQFSQGVLIFLIGFNKKVLLANNFALAADEVFGSTPGGLLSAWLGLLAYTFQIYFDFSGYSDMAVGLGRMLGFEFPRNFDGPYRSASITEFWRRWHISLSRWIRDYLYISLGGNRHGVVATYRNLAISMLLCGLWHGADWTFIVWGAFHASLLILERVRGGQPFYGRLPRRGGVFCTWVLVMVGWVIFRNSTLVAAGQHLLALVDVRHFGFSADSYWLLQPWFYGLVALGFLLVFWGKDSFVLAERRTLLTVVTQTVLFAVAVGELLSQGHNPFLYFQF